MIAFLKGIVESKTLDSIILNVNGIGYEVNVNNSSISSIIKDDKVKVYIKEQIKEDAHDLYGFMTLDEKEMFEKLLSVKNVGPRVAMSVLNIGSSDSVKKAIAGGDTKLLQTAKGVGRRAAEQIVVELRDKVGLGSSLEAEAIVSRSSDSNSDEAIEALLSLGYSLYDAKLAMAHIDPSLPLESRIKEALKGVSV